MRPEVEVGEDVRRDIQKGLMELARRELKRIDRVVAAGFIEEAWRVLEAIMDLLDAAERWK